MNVLEARESASLEQLAADTTSPNHKHFGALQKVKAESEIREGRVFEIVNKA